MNKKFLILIYLFFVEIKFRVEIKNIDIFFNYYIIFFYYFIIVIINRLYIVSFEVFEIGLYDYWDVRFLD